MTQSINLNGHELNIGLDATWGGRQCFGGIFDGNHCTIRGLGNNKSLFACIQGGTLKNLSVYGKVSGNSNIGGIVGYILNGGTLENLTSYVTVDGVSTLGGIVGNAEHQNSTILNCVNYGSVTGATWNIGGITGCGGHNIIGCVNFGNVHSSGSDNIGGIAGTTKNTGSITGCYNYGTVSTPNGRCGGIAGLANNKIIDCVNYGDVSGGWCTGGILGFVAAGEKVTITNCANFGNVVGRTGIGGILGESENTKTVDGKVYPTAVATITGCTNNGTVTGTWGAGGIAGNIKAGNVIENCVNNGTLNANGQLGGIVGICYGKVTGCTNNGNVFGQNDIIGGIVGDLQDATYVNEIETTNTQNGTVTGTNSKPIIGRK